MFGVSFIAGVVAALFSFRRGRQEDASKTIYLTVGCALFFADSLLGDYCDLHPQPYPRFADIRGDIEFLGFLFLVVQLFFWVTPHGKRRVQ